MRFCFLLVLLLTFNSTWSQKQQLRFTIAINNQSIELNRPYYLSVIDDSITFESILFYVSNIEIYQQNTVVHKFSKKHHLIDLSDESTLSLPYSYAGEFDQIKFNLGVDSITSVSGVFGGDLDPINGMYWTWQGGYINCKIEGISPKCPARKNKFQYHIGGYAAPFNSLQTIDLAVAENMSLVQLDLNQFFNQVDVSESFVIMSPNEEAVKIAHIVATSFNIRNE